MQCSSSSKALVANGGVAQVGGLCHEGSLATSTVLLTSAAVGTGVLALPHSVSCVGLLPSLVIFAVAALAALVSNLILFDCVRETSHGSYSELMTAVLGKSGAVVLDAFILVEGLGSVATYVVFISDFVPQVCALGGEDMWCTSASKVTLAAFVIIWPLSCQGGLSSLRYISTCSIATLIYTAVVVIVRTPTAFNRSGYELSEHLGDTQLNVTAFQVLSVACFAFMTHLNTPQIALQLRSPSRRRAAQVVGGSTAFLWLVYCLIATCGFLSFPAQIEQDFLTNYELHDDLIIPSRCMLSVTLVFACPINTYPAIQAFFNILDNLTAGEGTDKSLQRSLKARVIVTTLFLVLVVGIALRMPRVADLISATSAFFTAPLMFTFPAIMYRSVLRRRGILIPAFLHLLTVSLWLAEISRLV